MRPGFDNQQGLTFSPCNHNQTTCVVQHASYPNIGNYFPVGKVSILQDDRSLPSTGEEKCMWIHNFFPRVFSKQHLIKEREGLVL